MPYLGHPPSTGEENNFKILDDISSYTLTFDGSSSSVVSTSDETIYSYDHRFIQGQRVTYNNGGGGNIAGLTSGTAYFIIKEDHNNIKLATSASNAQSGTAVNITAVGSGSSHTLTVAFDGVNTKFKATHTTGKKARITRGAQLVLSVNGVIQQPHDSSTPSTGFGFDLDSTIVFSQAPASTDAFWGHILTNNNVTFDISDNKVDHFSGDGSTSSFTLSKSPPNNENILVTIDGVVQYPNDGAGNIRAYSVAANVINFTTAPGSGTQIEVRHIGFAGATTGSGGGGVTGVYGRTGNVVLIDSDNITVNDAAITGNATVSGNTTITGDLTVNGTTTTLDTVLTEVDQLLVAANNTTVGAAITQSGSGNILSLYDGAAELFTVADGGNVTIKNITGTPNFNIQGTNASATAESNLNFLLRDGNSADRTVAKVTARNTGNGGYGALDFYTAFNNTNTRRMSIHQNGYVGIGTATPDSKLNLIGTGSDAATRISIKDGVGISNLLGRNGNLTFQADVDNAVSGSLISFAIDGSEKLRIKSNGFVGIGTDNPSRFLHVQDGSNTLLALDSTDSNADLVQSDTGGSTRIRSASGALEFYTNGDASSTNATSSTKKVTIDSGGRVGIKNASPSSQYFNNLVVGDNSSGDWGITIRTNSSNKGVLAFSDSDAADANRYDGYIAYHHNGQSMRFHTAGANERLRITSLGKVGIGITNPSQKLTVQGTILKTRSDSGVGLIYLSNDGSNNGYINVNQNAGVTRVKLNSAGDSYFNGGDLSLGTTSPNSYSNQRVFTINGTDYGRLDLEVGGSLKGSVWANSGGLGLDAGGNTIEMYAGSVQRVFINSNGQIGIGSNFSPSRHLDIKDPTGANRIVNIRGTGTSGAFLAFLDANTTDDSKCRIGSVGGNNIGIRGDTHKFQSGAGANRMVIDSNGQVGVGVDTPGRKLHIKDAGIIKLENTSTGGWLGLEFLGSSGTNDYDAYMGVLDSNGLFFIDNNSNGNDISINRTGKVFIGADTTDFSDAGTFLNLRNNTFGGRIGFSNNTATAGVALMEQFAYWGSNKVAGMIITAGTDTTNKDDASMSFYTAPAGTLNQRLHISSTGLIGINQGSSYAPLTSLDVRHHNGIAGNATKQYLLTVCAQRNSARGLEIGTGHPTSGNQNDAGVYYNAKDTENSSYHCQHVWQLGGNNAMVLGYTGNKHLGVGIDTPSYRVDVAAPENSYAIRATGGIRIDTNTGSNKQIATASGVYYTTATLTSSNNTWYTVAKIQYASGSFTCTVGDASSRNVMTGHFMATVPAYGVSFLSKKESSGAWNTGSSDIQIVNDGTYMAIQVKHDSYYNDSNSAGCYLMLVQTY